MRVFLSTLLYLTTYISFILNRKQLRFVVYKICMGQRSIIFLSLATFQSKIGDIQFLNSSDHIHLKMWRGLFTKWNIDRQIALKLQYLKKYYYGYNLGRSRSLFAMGICNIPKWKKRFAWHGISALHKSIW